jgi:hypothetical protein
VLWIRGKGLRKRLNDKSGIGSFTRYKHAGGAQAPRPVLKEPTGFEVTRVRNAEKRRTAPTFKFTPQLSLRQNSGYSNSKINRMSQMFSTMKFRYPPITSRIEKNSMIIEKNHNGCFPEPKITARKQSLRSPLINEVPISKKIDNYRPSYYSQSTQKFEEAR